jgi:hypothetical protein
VKKRGRGSRAKVEGRGKPRRDRGARGSGEARDKARDRSATKGRGGERPAGLKWERRTPAANLGPIERVVSGDGAWIAFVIFLILLWVAFYHQVFFGGMMLSSPDAVAPAGFGVVGKEALENGVYPLWNPYVFLGMPSFSSLAYNPYVYPVGFGLKVIWPIMQLPMMWLLIYYVAGGLGVLLLLRKLSLPAAAAAFGAAAFMFTPNLVAVGAYGHGSQLMASMYIPFIFLVTHRLLTRGRIVYAGGLALLFGLQLLRGHVQISYYTAMMIGIMTIYWAVRHLKGRDTTLAARAAGLTALAVVLALGLASVLYIPVHNYSDLSVRAAGEHGGLGIERAGMWSLSFKEMTTFLLPGMLGFGKNTYWGTMPFTDYPNYMGILTLALAIFAVLRWRREPTVTLLALLAVVALVMSFGRHLGPLYELAYRWLPFFKKFRVPVMIVVLLQFAVACLAAYGLTELLRRKPKPEGGSVMPWAMAGVAALMLVFLAAGSGLRDAYVGLMAQARGEGFARAMGSQAFAGLRLDVLVVGAVALIGMALILAFHRRLVSVGILSIGLICLLCLDVWRVDYRLMESTLSERGGELKRLEEDPVALFLAEDEDLFRVYPLGRSFSDNSLTAYKVASVGGYHAAKPRIWDEWANAHVDADLWSSTGNRELPLGRDQRLPVGAMMNGVRRMLGIKYVIAEGELRGAEGLEVAFREREGGGTGGRVVYRTDDWMPKAFCVPEVRGVEDGREALRGILSPSFDPEALALVENGVDLAVAAAGSAYVTSYGLNHVEARVQSAGPTFLVLGDLFIDGWSATLDGEKVPLYKTNFLVRGVAVPAGSHTVRMEYFDPGLALGLKLSVGCAIVIIGMMLPASVRGVNTLYRRRKEK